MNQLTSFGKTILIIVLCFVVIIMFIWAGLYNNKKEDMLYKRSMETYTSKTYNNIVFIQKPDVKYLNYLLEEKEYDKLQKLLILCRESSINIRKNDEFIDKTNSLNIIYLFIDKLARNPKYNGFFTTNKSLMDFYNESKFYIELFDLEE